MHVQRKVKCMLKKSNTWVPEVGIGNYFGGIIFLLSKNGSPPHFIKPLDLTSGISMREMRKDFNYFNLYSI